MVFQRRIEAELRNVRSGAPLPPLHWKDLTEPPRPRPERPSSRDPPQARPSCAPISPSVWNRVHVHREVTDAWNTVGIVTQSLTLFIVQVPAPTRAVGLLASQSPVGRGGHGDSGQRGSQSFLSHGRKRSHALSAHLLPLSEVSQRSEVMTVALMATWAAPP